MRLVPLARLVLAGALLTAPAAAQKDNPGKSTDSTDAPDSVVLKNGSLVSGRILDDDPKSGITIKMPSGKVRIIPPGDIKVVDRSDGTKRETPPEAVKTTTPAGPSPKERAEDAPPVVGYEGKLHDGVRYGVGVDLAMVLSRANADGTLKVLSPAFGIHGAIDVGVGSGFYLRLDPGFKTFSRTSSLKVPTSITTDSNGNETIFEQTATNKVRIYDVTLRAQLGYDWTPRITTRLGIRGGLDIASGSSSFCDTGDSRTSFGYGFATTPIAARFGEKRALEVGLTFDYLVSTMPRCGVGNLDGLSIPVGQTVAFAPVVSSEVVAVAELGLSATYLFW